MLLIYFCKLFSLIYIFLLFKKSVGGISKIGAIISEFINFLLKRSIQFSVTMVGKNGPIQLELIK